MITLVCAVHDRALNAFMQPFHAHSTGQAIRSFTDEINREGTDFNKHPEDYDLYHLAEYDNETGQFDNMPQKPIQLAIGKNLHVKE